jgi:hypothetical protein
MRGPPVRLRDLTGEERSASETLARSRTALARPVERARLVRRASRDEAPPSIAAALGPDAEMVRRALSREPVRRAKLPAYLVDQGHKGPEEG